MPSQVNEHADAAFDFQQHCSRHTTTKTRSSSTDWSRLQADHVVLSHLLQVRPPFLLDPHLPCAPIGPWARSPCAMSRNSSYELRAHAGNVDGLEKSRHRIWTLVVSRRLQSRSETRTFAKPFVFNNWSAQDPWIAYYSVDCVFGSSMRRLQTL